MTEEEQARELLRKYIAGGANSQDAKKVEDWYESLAQQEDLPEARKTAIGEEILAELRLAMAEQPKIKKLYLHTVLSKVAAVLLIGSAIGLGIWKFSSGPDVLNHLVTVSTTIGERKKVILTDGSEIFMEPLAKLSYPSAFGSDNRNITLNKGEAFFNIAHESKRSFTVRTALGVCVKVLGTSFRVRSNDKQKDINVAVSTGKVEVLNAGGTVGTLTKGQQITVEKNTRKAPIRPYKNTRAVSIAFEEATLQQVIKRLEYLYSVKIMLSSPELENLKCTATFYTNQQPTAILDVICSLHHIKFIESKDHKTFKITR